MPITESRLKNGTLTLDAISFATQATNVRLVPSTDVTGDTLEVLSGDTILGTDETTWSLVITAVQDFDNAAGFVNFAMANAGDVVPFVWEPNSPTGDAVGAGVSYSGSVRVRPVEVGGDVNSRLTTDAEWPLQGAPTATY